MNLIFCSVIISAIIIIALDEESFSYWKDIIGKDCQLHFDVEARAGEILEVLLVTQPHTAPKRQTQ